MDDTRTNETLDALADLFLTGVDSSPRKPPQRIPPKARPDGQAAGEVDAQSDEATADPSRSKTAIEELDGPQTLSMGRGQSTPLEAPPSVRSVERDEPKPAMRLTSDYDDMPQMPVHVEAVFLGNLPGFGGPWLSQYAFQLAQQLGPVGVLHFSGDQIDLELITAERHAIRAGIDEPFRSVADADALVKRLGRLSRDLDLPVANWLIHLPAPPEPEDIAIASTFSHWTILCGADDAAIAGASRMVQQLVEGVAALDSPAEDADDAGDETRLSHLIGVAIMGSDESKAREAIGKFNAAASGFLRQPIELVASRKQMTPVYLRVIGTFQGDDLWPKVQAFLDEQPVASRPVPEMDEREASDSTVETPLPADTQAIRDEAAAASGRPAMPPVAEPPVEEIEETHYVPNLQPIVTASAMPRGMPRPSAAPKAAPADPVASRAMGEPDLASLIAPSMGGGVPLDARYPKQPQTQLLLDQNGCIHLLRRQAAGELRSAIVDLLEVRDWVREHMQILALTQRQCRFDAKAEPVLHLFTGEAKTAAALVSKLGPFVKLHLLQEVRIGSEGTWVCTDLN